MEHAVVSSHGFIRKEIEMRRRSCLTPKVKDGFVTRGDHYAVHSAPDYVL